MARLRSERSGPKHRIAVVEDDPDLRASVVGLFEREGHEVRTAADAASAVQLVAEFRPHLTLLDYYLERGTGADVVSEMRTFDTMSQVLLVTGYATEQPPRTLLAELDIQGYHDKGDGPARLMVLADAALKHYRTLEGLHRQRAYLSHIVEAASGLMEIQPPEVLLQRALRDAVGLLRAAGGLVATVNSGLFVLGSCESRAVALRAGAGRFAGASALDQLPGRIAAAVRDGLDSDMPRAHESGLVLIPLKTRHGERGCICIEAPDLPAEAIEPCRLYARQVVAALENVILFEKATVDPLTGTNNRGHGRQRLLDTLKLGTRTDAPTGVLVIDIDHFKEFNDEYGHAAGDLILRRVAQTLVRLLRSSDVVARWGGEEFVIGLPATDCGGARVVAEKLRRGIADIAAPFEGRALSVTISTGVAIAEPGDLNVDAVIERADRQLYRAKRGGRNCVYIDARTETELRRDRAAS